MNALSLLTASGMALLCLVLSACEQPGTQSDTDDLRAEIDQLENQLGRLEFRIFELERLAGQQPASTAGPAPAPERPAKEPPAADGRYDLTPVE